MILRDHHDFILRTADRFRSLGAEVYFADEGLTYYEYVIHPSLKGKYKGRIFGFPCIGIGMCGFKRDGKLRALIRCNVGYYDYEDIGIAIDEPARHGQLNDRLRSILCETRTTGLQAKFFDLEHGILSPQYTYSFGKKHNRDGCALCYNATERERKAWFRDYPEAIPLVIELQNIVKQKRPDNRPLRNYKWFIDD